MKMLDRNDSPVTSMPTEADIDRFTDEPTNAGNRSSTASA
jgi:hypothetical protein